METVISFTSFLFFIISLYYFITANNKKYSQRRIREAERYFNGSIIRKNEYVDGGIRKSGLALSRDKDGKYRFKKQSKPADTSILY